MDTNQLYDAIEEILTLTDITYSEKVIHMMIETACVESCCGKYIKQINGPACGIFQIEPNTAKDIYDNFIIYRPYYKKGYDLLYNKKLTLEQNLIYNLAFQIFMCRIFYIRIPEPIPNTTMDRATYWKKYYNTTKGKGSTQDYIIKVRTYYDRKYN